MAHNNVHRSRPGQPSLSERMAQRAAAGSQASESTSTISARAERRNGGNWTYDGVHMTPQGLTNLVRARDAVMDEALIIETSRNTTQGHFGRSYSAAQYAPQPHMTTARSFTTSGSLTGRLGFITDYNNYSNSVNRLYKDDYLQHLEGSYLPRGYSHLSATVTQEKLTRKELESTKALLKISENEKRDLQGKLEDLKKQLQIEKEKLKLVPPSLSEKTRQNAEEGASQGDTKHTFAANLFLAEVDEWGEGFTGKFSFEGCSEMDFWKSSTFERLNSVRKAFPEGELVCIGESGDPKGEAKLGLKNLFIYEGYPSLPDGRNNRVDCSDFEGKLLALSVPIEVFQECYRETGWGPLGVSFRIRAEASEDSEDGPLGESISTWLSKFSLEIAGVVIAAGPDIPRVSSEELGQSRHLLDRCKSALKEFASLADLKAPRGDLSLSSFWGTSRGGSTRPKSYLVTAQRSAYVMPGSVKNQFGAKDFAEAGQSPVGSFFRPTSGSSTWYASTEDLQAQFMAYQAWAGAADSAASNPAAQAAQEDQVRLARTLLDSGRAAFLNTDIS